MATKDKSIFYSTGKPCKHGHPSKRYVSNGACVACVGIRQKLGSKTYRKVHPMKEDLRRTQYSDEEQRSVRSAINKAKAQQRERDKSIKGE